ncbi:FxsA family protein [Chromatocurvus halotolerans]|uniref:UPF0716 protein FxsA n=1 Tax=Chromatocurvus halotolerans TaxID=1132028 RepID=A0A4V2SBB7_9GAMM|nr:FxsA family protein [Chromatocurvus halotolerans]TCO74880.1 UPF0716 protein FxsA [Chromatocurvus halotolerans]
MRYVILLMPWLELLTLIQLGVAVGALTALAYVFLTLVAGIMLLRFQGRDMFMRLREAQDGRIFGPQILVDDMAVGLAALLLMIPGLITDVAALLVLFGPLRRRVSRWLFGGGSATGPESRGPDQPGPEAPATIEGEYRRVDEEKR